ncbi:MAG: conjugal transfer protein TraX [Lachnospiraceae bacterium]|nr:conjugal transfer protein TraX [Lachnospiraceae bacterium]
MDENIENNNEIEESKRGLSSSALKLIAMVSMLIDHIGAGFLEKGYLPYLKRSFGGTSAIYEKWDLIDSYMRLIGRLAFPIFCFVLVEGFLHTRDLKKYLARLFIFAIISEIPFDMCFRKAYVNWNYQNVIWTMFLGVLAMAALKMIDDKSTAKAMNIILSILVVVLFGALGVLLKTDYNGVGVCLIIVFWFLRDNEFFRDLCGSIVILGAGIIEIASYPSFVLMHFYNGERGINLKYLFYVFYPMHIFIIALVRIAVFGG